VTATELSIGPLLAAVLVLLTGYAAALAWLGRIGTGRQTITAALRAVVQLAAVSLVVVAVLSSGWLTGGFVVLMFVVAAVTTARRLARGAVWLWPAGLAIGGGVAPVLAVILASGVLPLRGVAVVPTAGILIGGAMTAASLAGRRALDELRNRRGEFEAGLALGMTDRDAAMEVCRPTTAQALMPALDQTRTVGLVTLPGAFVGVLLGGGGPIQAGAIQLLVLIGLLAVETVAALLIVELVARGRLARLDVRGH
jgi:putative ABC transport system permease protein